MILQTSSAVPSSPLRQRHSVILASCTYPPAGRAACSLPAPHLILLQPWLSFWLMRRAIVFSTLPSPCALCSNTPRVISTALYFTKSSQDLSIICSFSATFAKSELQMLIIGANFVLHLPRADTWHLQGSQWPLLKLSVFPPGKNHISEN